MPVSGFAQDEYGISAVSCYAHELAAVKRRRPAEDIMSILTTRLDRSDRDQRAIDEFENQFWLFAMAGNSTVRNSLPGALYTLLTQPGAWESLRRDRSLLPTAIEEILRFWTPVMHMRRTAAHDTELAGVRIAAGQKVVPWLASANRDGRVFAEPIASTSGDSPTITCPSDTARILHSAQLARAELSALLSALLDVPGTPRLAGDPVQLRSNFHNLFKRLPVRYEHVRRIA